MRERSRGKGRLEDIVFYANNVKKILDGVSYDDYVNDVRIYYSVMKNIEIIGEAANMLSKDFIETHTGLPWKQIIGMRHVLVHGYAQVSNVDLWDTAKNDIDPLCQKVLEYLNDIDWDSWVRI